MNIICKNKKLLIVAVCFYSFVKTKVFPKVLLSQRNMASMQVYLRHDQKIADIGKEEYQAEFVKIYAPDWIKQALQIINDEINLPEACSITLKDQLYSSMQYKIKFPLKLKDLVVLSRNEPYNVSGKIAFDLYKPLIHSAEVIYALKDIVRQTIIIGFDETVAYGGYPKHLCPKKQSSPVILIDTINLQFLQPYNSGRLVLIGQNVPRGILDDFIYERIVGEKKLSYLEALKNETGRYIQYDDEAVFDTKAYELFVANDVLLACIAINKFADQSVKPVKLKFLNYETGLFSGSFGPSIEKHIYLGIETGLSRFFKNYENSMISAFEFPFYKRNENILKICVEHKVDCYFTMDDALKQSDCLLMALTNCANPHAMPGNEMGYTSKNAAIAQNLKSKAFTFNPAINLSIVEDFIDFNQGNRRTENVDGEHITQTE